MKQLPPPALFDLAEAESVRLWPQDGSVHYRSPGPISPALRELILANKPALLVRLAEWDGPEAIRLMHEADSTVERLGVSGRDPRIQDAAASCVAAHRREDMPGVRRACGLVEDRARQLVSLRSAA